MKFTPLAAAIAAIAAIAATVAAPVAAAPSSYIGVITAAQVVDVTPRFPGVITAVGVHVGDRVTAGQIVAEMDPKSMAEELIAARAALAAARATANQARVDRDDAQRKLDLETALVAQGVEPREKVDEARAGLERVTATYAKASFDVASAASHAQTAQDHVRDTALRAPTDGTVLLRYKDPGATAGTADKILRIVGNGGVVLRFAVPPDRVHELSPKGAVTARIDTVAVPVTAVIRQISPALDPASGLVFVEAELIAEPAVQERLQPGLAVWVAPAVNSPSATAGARSK